MGGFSHNGSAVYHAGNERGKLPEITPPPEDDDDLRFLPNNNPTRGPAICPLLPSFPPPPPGAHVADLIFPRPPKGAVEVVRVAGGLGQPVVGPSVPRSTCPPRSEARARRERAHNQIEARNAVWSTDQKAFWLTGSPERRPTDRDMLAPSIGDRPV